MRNWNLLSACLDSQTCSVLIEPCGIETAWKAVGAEDPKVLIEPCGIETNPNMLVLYF